MAETPSLHDRIAGLFSGKLNVDPPETDADLFEAGVLDSLAFVELLLHVEREFGVTVAVDDLQVENFRSIDRIAAFVTARAPITSTTSQQAPAVEVNA